MEILIRQLKPAIIESETYVSFTSVKHMVLPHTVSNATDVLNQAGLKQQLGAT